MFIFNKHKDKDYCLLVNDNREVINTLFIMKR
jgi:hypothetical protein